VAYFALIVGAAALNTWFGLAVFLALTALALWRFFQRSTPEPPGPAPQGGGSA